MRESGKNHAPLIKSSLAKHDASPAPKNSPLPPSVEKAYHQKCIELKRRLRDVEETNDVARLRVYRVERAIAKMRIERAILLDTLKKKQDLVARDFEDEDESMPESPRLHSHDHRKHSGPSDLRRGGPTPPIPSQHNPYAGHPQYAQAALPSNYGTANNAALAPYTTTSARQSSTSHAHPSHSQTPHHHTHSNATTQQLSTTAYNHGATQLPLIQSLPNGTSVMLVAPGIPKPSPWVITELDPRHHVNIEFDNLSIEAQEEAIYTNEYLPFDIHGRPVLLHYDPHKNRYKHIFYDSPDWVDPVEGSVRQDNSTKREAQSLKGRIYKARAAQVAQGLLAPEEARGGLSPNVRGNALSSLPMPSQGQVPRGMNPEAAQTPHSSHSIPPYRHSDATPSHSQGHGHGPGHGHATSTTAGGRYQQPLAPAPARPSLQPAGSTGASHGSQSFDQGSVDASVPERAYSHGQSHGHSHSHGPGHTHARHGSGSHGQTNYDQPGGDDKWMLDGELRNIKLHKAMEIEEDREAVGREREREHGGDLARSQSHSRNESGGRAAGGSAAASSTGGHGRSTSRTGGPPTGGFTAANR